MHQEEEGKKRRLQGLKCKPWTRVQGESLCIYPGKYKVPLVRDHEKPQQIPSQAYYYNKPGNYTARPRFIAQKHFLSYMVDKPFC